MGFISKLGKALRFAGSKVTSGAKWLGNKVGNALLAAAPVAAAISPAIGGGIAAAGGMAKGIGQIAGMANSAINGAPVDFAGMRSTYNQVRSQGREVAQAYASVRGNLQSALERPK